MDVTFRELEPFYGEKTYLSVLFMVSPELQQLEQSLVQDEGGQKEQNNKDGGTTRIC
jgi:hypothetical protein